MSRSGPAGTSTPAWLQSIEEASRAGLAAIDSSGRQIYVNPAFCRLVGFAAEELVGLRAPFPYWPPEEAGRMREAFELTLRGAAPEEGFTLRFMRRGGERFAARMLLSPLQGSGGERGWLASIYDLAGLERGHADRQLLTALVEASGEGIIVADGQGTIRIFNPEAVRQHGRTLAEVDASSWVPVYGLERLDGTPLPLEETPLFRALNGARLEDQLWRVRRPDGTLRILSGTATPLRTAGGEPSGAMVVTRDVTLRERAEQERLEALVREQMIRVEAERSLALLETLLVTAPVGMCFVDRQLRSVRMNERLAALNGIAVKDAIGKPLSAVVPGPAPGIEPLCRRVLETGEPLIDHEISAFTPGSPEKRDFAISGYPIRDSRGAISMMGLVLRETTAERRAAEERLALRERAVRAETLAAGREQLSLSDQILRAVPDAIVVTDLQGTITRWSGGAEQVFGYSSAEAVGRPLNFVHTPDVRERATAAIIDSIARTGSFLGVIPCIHGRDHREIQVEVTASTWRNEAGEPMALIGVSRDITERLRAQAERENLVRERTAKAETEASERRFRILAEATSDIVWRTDLDGVPRVDSPGWRAFTGQTEAQWLAGEWLEAIHPDDREVARALVGEAIAGKRPFAHEYRLRRHDGVYVPMAVRGAPVLDEHGQVTEWIGANQDITGRISQERERERLLHSERAARADADAARGRIALLDRITARLVGELERGEDALQRVAEMLVPELADWCSVYLPLPSGEVVLAAIAHTDRKLAESRRTLRLQQPLDPRQSWGAPRVLRTGTAELITDIDQGSGGLPAEELARVLASGTRSMLGVPLTAQGRTVGAMMLSRGRARPLFDHDDLELAAEIGVRTALSFEQARLLDQARTARAEAEAASRAKDEFLAMLGHELRNPLAPILTALHLLNLRGGPDTLRERTIIERQLRHMVRLVDDLLDVSRITRGRVELRLARHDLAEILSRAVEGASSLMEQRRHLLALSLSPGLAVDGDAARLAQVFANLLNNAAKYTPEGGRIEVTLGAEGAEAVVQVRDNGAGIEPALLPRIFDLFVQAAQTIDRAEGGLGIGLTIVRRLVELHRGTVSARSEGRGRGTTIEVRLPLAARATPAAAGPPDAAMPAQPPSARAARVLVVDDNADGAMMISEALSLSGFQVAVAHDGPSALAIAQRERFDAVLLDLGLPVMDGCEVARRLRQALGPATPLLLAVTGYGLPADLARAKQAGFAGHLVKPVDFERLLRVLRDGLLRRSS